MRYPCFTCKDRHICNKSCAEKEAYKQFRKENIKKNKALAKDSGLLKK